MELIEQVKVISISGEKKNLYQANIGHALPLKIHDDNKHGTITFEYLSDGQQFYRHVLTEDLHGFRIGQVLTQVTS